MNNPVSVTVIVCSNRPGPGLTRSILSVAACVPAPSEILLVAQFEATDWDLGELEALVGSGTVRVIYDPGKGLSRARNIGMAAASGGYILFTDDDCVVEPNWVGDHLAVLHDHPNAGVIFGAVRPPDSSAGGAVPTFDPDESVGGPRNRDGYVLGMGANMGFPRETALKVGAFDEVLGAGATLASGEDMDYALRARASGLEVVGSSQPSVVHVDGVRQSGASSRNLWTRDGIGLGASAAKAMRFRDFRGSWVLTRFLGSIFVRAVQKAARGQAHSGLRMATHLTLGAIKGFALAATAPVEVGLAKGTVFRVSA
jgi:glycosyltransferase involved in cell wall biosynthesis